jgi:YVTN family beta-propeller protein
MFARYLVVVVVALAAVAQSQPQRPYLHAPAVEEYARHDPTGTTILPNGRFLKPLGRHLPMARWPHGLAVSPDGSAVFVASDGVGQVVTGWEEEKPAIAALAPGSGTPAGAGNRQRRANAGGVAFSPDGKRLYWSSGESGAVYVFDLESKRKVGEISLNTEVDGRRYEDSFAMDLKLSPDGATLYCADVANFRVAAIDLERGQVVGSVAVGRYPYALAVAGRCVYVANIGMFEYHAVPPPAEPRQPLAQVPDPRGLTFPPYGFPSREAREGVEVEGRRVPGLGDPNAPESFSVWGIDVEDPRRPRVFARLKTGLLVGAPADGGKSVGGSAPNFLAASPASASTRDSLYVSNGNNDMVERFDLGSNRHPLAPAPVAAARIRPSPLVASLRGVGPAGMGVSPDGARLYVAESGINAIAVIETQSMKVLGHLPTAWYPYRVALSPDGRRLFCICFKGFGNGPSGGKEIPNSPFLGMKGVLSVIPVPADGDLPALTATVLACNGIVAREEPRAGPASGPVIPTSPGHASEQVRYVVFITKENHTYDTIFDRIPGANHDPALLRWGYHQRIAGPGQPTLEDAAVMTNHNALARQFTVSDNFYMEPEFSGVGHRWLVGVQPDNFCQMTYTLGWSFILNSSAPGRRAAFGSNGSIAPEDYPESGSMWEHLARNGIGFRNYGEGFEFAGIDEGEGNGRTGARETVNIPMPKVLFDNTCREYPIFNMNIPDQYRADWFIQDFTRLFLDGKQEMPRFVNIAICNDHGADPKPAKGYPYLASWMADNDLALGRIVEFLSHTPYWKNMAIFVTQDDSGGEPDHVDAQRSVLLVISPWARRGNVSHRHTTILSMHRTLYQILGLPPLNMFDALANDFSDCFTSRPDFAPYQHQSVDPRIFDPAKAKDAADPDYQRARRQPSIPMDDPEDMERFSRMGR